MAFQCKNYNCVYAVSQEKFIVIVGNKNRKYHQYMMYIWFKYINIEQLSIAYFVQVTYQ